LEATWTLPAWIRFPHTHCVLVSEIGGWGNYQMFLVTLRWFL
jgi:hypothetical protein